MNGLITAIISITKRKISIAQNIVTRIFIIHLSVFASSGEYLLHNASAINNTAIIKSNLKLSPPFKEV